MQEVQEEQWHVVQVRHLSEGGVIEDVREDPHGVVEVVCSWLV